MPARLETEQTLGESEVGIFRSAVARLGFSVPDRPGILWTEREGSYPRYDSTYLSAPTYAVAVCAVPDLRSGADVDLAAPEGSEGHHDS
eukprot:8666144-Pyramimonas_sp.AAC.1